MKINIQFANGEEREYEDSNATDFGILVGKLMLKKILLMGNEVFNTDMVVKVTKVD